MSTMTIVLLVTLVCALAFWQGGNGAAILLETGNRWQPTYQRSSHRGIIPLDGQILAARELSGIDDQVLGLVESVENDAISDPGEQQSVAGGWFPRGKRSTRQDQQKVIPLSPDDGYLVIVGGKRKLGNLWSDVVPLRRAVPPPGFSAPRGKKTMESKHLDTDTSSQ